MLLSACSQYDKTHSTAKPAQRNVYAAGLTYDADWNSPQDDTVYGIDTDIMEIYANAAHTTTPSSTSQFIPREQWLQLTQEQRDAIIDKRRK